MRSLFWVGLMLLVAIPIGCYRSRYRQAADREAYSLLKQKASQAPWEPPSDFTLQPLPISRLFDSTPHDDPWLPIPAPQLYAYRLPDLPGPVYRTSGRAVAPPAELPPAELPPAELPPAELPPADSGRPEEIAAPADIHVELDARVIRLPPTGEPRDSRAVQLASRVITAAPDAKPGPEARPVSTSTTTYRWLDKSEDSSKSSAESSRRPSSSRPPAIMSPAPAVLSPAMDPPAKPARLPETLSVATEQQPPETIPAPAAAQPPDRLPDRTSQRAVSGGDADFIELAKIPADAWEAVPAACRMRMLEFRTLAEEYTRTYGSEPTPDLLAPGQRLSLEDIVYLSLLNSREYQTQKETLYRVALRLSLERFAYQIKFSPFANSSTTTFNRTRSGGQAVSGLGIGTGFQMDQMLATGGDVLVRFANSVVMTFNGPAGFAADIGSDLFYEIDQTIFQNDVRFESLTQAERDVIYAARDFARFRKTLFTQLAAQYYNLIRTYRQVEIDSQNYFTLVRAFGQSLNEFRTGFLPRFQLDQVEQNVLSGRSRLIATCNNLESVLDTLKIRIGLPTETQINIDLTELEQLTNRDELSVTGELVRRARERLLEKRQEEQQSRIELLSDSIVLIERLLQAQRLQQLVMSPARETGDLLGSLQFMRVESARESVGLIERELQQELDKKPPRQLVVFQRTQDLIQSLLDLSVRQMEYSEHRRLDNQQSEPHRRREQAYRKRAEELTKEWSQLVESRQLEQLPQLIKKADQLRDEVESAVSQLDRMLEISPRKLSPKEQLTRSLADADQFLAQSGEMLEGLEGGLSPIAIDMDDAMLTALNLRFDLMNRRGEVADAWREIKFAGDDLKSILRINARQQIGTRADVNRPFQFTMDESETRIRASFDAPFNRLDQRNTYRQSLINYQASLRQLMQVEDNIKLSVRNDLRGLALDRDQYAIEVASAALAYERVVSVRLELRLGIGRVAARDFLEAQNAYASSLSNVASRHIGYIVDRTQLFLDLELLNVGEDGFWQELYDDRFQPEPYYQLPPYAIPVYGELVPGLWYSKYLRRMQQVPPGDSGVHVTDSPTGPPARLEAAQ